MENLQNETGRLGGENREWPDTAHNYADPDEWPGPEAEEPMTPGQAVEHEIVIDGLYGQMDHMGG